MTKYRASVVGAVALAVASIATGVAQAQHVSAGVTVTVAQHAPVHYGGLYIVYFGLPKKDHASLTGQVTGAPAGTPVELQAKTFPFHKPFGNTAATTTNSSGAFTFTVRPALETRYRVRVLTATSRTVSYYVTGGFREPQPGHCQTAPTCRVTAVVLNYYPRAVARREGTKHWFLYQGVKRNCCHDPAPPKRLSRSASATARVHRVNATTYRLKVTFTYHVGAHYYWYRWGTCQRESARSDGFGLPRHIGPCGARSLPWKLFSLAVVT
jgi:hypothetical protein